MKKKLKKFAAAVVTAAVVLNSVPFMTLAEDFGSGDSDWEIFEENGEAISGEIAAEDTQNMDIFGDSAAAVDTERDTAEDEIPVESSEFEAAPDESFSGDVFEDGSEEILFDDGEPEEEDVFGDGESTEDIVEDGVLGGELLGNGLASESLLSASGVSDNRNRQNYSVWSSPVKSYLTADASGYMRVEYAEGQVVIERYNAALQLQSQGYITSELPYFGGFYAGSNAYYLVFGQSNLAEDDSAEVIRVVKYDKSWNRIGAASLRGANTTYPFDAGSLRMAEYGGYLYIRTSHEMYTSSDGLNHQANLTMQVRISDMEIVDSYYRVMNISEGYVSHSFNQFIIVDDQANIVALDHGDAYPRCAAIGTYSAPAGGEFFTGDYYAGSVFGFRGETGQNYTGASMGGLEYSASHYLAAGNSVLQDEAWSDHSVRNIFVTSTARNLKNSFSSSSKWITNYTEASGISASTPQLVKLGSDSFLLLWAQMEGYSLNGKISYVFLDGAGNVTSSIYTKEGYLSDCKPAVSGEMAIWYVTDGEKLTFYKVKKDGSFEAEVGHIHTYEPKLQFTKTEVNCGLVEGSIENALTAETDGTITYASSDTDIASVDNSGKVTLKKLGTCTITVSASAGIHYAAKKISYTLHILPLKKQTIKAADSFIKTYGDAKFSLNASCSGGAKLTYASDNTKVAAVSAKGEVTVAGSGTAVLTITADPTTEYAGAVKKIPIEVKPKEISTCRLIFTKTGSMPSDSTEFSKYLAVADGETILQEGRDYQFWGNSWSSAGGQLLLLSKYVTGTGNYAGGGYLNASPISDPPALSSVLRETDGVTVTWEKETGALGYVIYRKVNSGSYALTATIKDNTAVSWKDKSATAAKSSYSYYIKAYTQNVNGKVYTKQSSAKTVAALQTPDMKFAKEVLNCGLIQETAANTLTTNTDGKITYSSSDTSIAAVDSTGKVTLKKLGKCTITASAAMTQRYEAKKVSYTLNVLPLKKQTIKVADSFTKTYGDAKFALNASCSGGAKLTYTSDNTKVVTVSSKGEVTVVGSGTAAITVASEQTDEYIGTVKKISIVVKPKNLSTCRLIFTKTGSMLADSAEFSKYLAIVDGETILQAGRDYRFGGSSWNSMGNQLLLLSKYVVGIGNYTGGGYLYTSPISDPPALSSVLRDTDGVTLSWEKETGALGYVIYKKVNSGSYSLAATIKDNTTVSWKDKSATAAKSSYSYYIKAYTKNQNGMVYTKQSSAKTAAALQTPDMKFAKGVLDCGLIQETASNKLTANTDGKITYSSSDTSIATVDSAGNVTLKKLGKCTITASAAMTQRYEAKKVSYTLNVLPLKKQTIKVADSFTKTYGDAKFALNASCSGGAKLTYVSDNTKVVTVSSRGEVTVVGSGTASVTITSDATSEYIGTAKKVQIKVTPKSIGKCRLIFTKIGPMSSDSSEFSKYLAVIDGNKLLKEGKDYEFWGSSSSSAGNSLYYVSKSVEGIGNYTGYESMSARPVSKNTVLTSAARTEKGVKLSWEKEEGAAGYCIYGKKGSEAYSLVQKITNRDTVNWTDTTASDAKETYAYYIKAYTLNSSGSIVYAEKSKTLTVAPKKTGMSECKIAAISSQVYTGKAIQPAVTVTYGKTTLTRDKDYTLTYSGNINAGTAKVTVKGKGDYSGTVTKEFTIKKAANSITAANFVKNASPSKVQTLSIGAKAKGGKFTYKSNNSKITVDKTGKVTIAKNYAGKATITITAGNSNYQTVKKNITVTVNRIANVITASNATRNYSAKAQTFSLGVKQKGKGKITYSSNNKMVKVNSAGKVTVSAKFVGKAVITVKAAASGIYKAVSKQITVTVKPPKTELSGAVNTAGKKMTVKWKKNSAVTGYEIQYSTDKNFKKGVKTVTIKKNSTISAVISKLVKGKTYYVRLRSYKQVSKVNYYADWSSRKQVKIQK
ncbi:MAG: Ig-like domain-containing protein [Eubacteriales bacterium]|nr:Ig-like domain-containing protein [Eubacteriales bacterium]